MSEFSPNNLNCKRKRDTKTRTIKKEDTQIGNRQSIVRESESEFKDDTEYQILKTEWVFLFEFDLGKYI